MQRLKAILFIAVLVGLVSLQTQAARAQEGDNARKFKILHVMSYHTGWEWTEDQLQGFKDGLGDVPVVYKVFAMDTKNKSTPELKEQTGKEARDLIDSWQPDLVFLSDDNAQIYVTKYYIDKDIPFVFCGVNGDPAVYGFVGSKNITGVLEREHITETINLLKELVSDVRRVVAIPDDDPTFSSETGVLGRLKETIARDFPDMEFIIPPPINTFQEYKDQITYYQDKADTVALLGIFTFKDAEDKNVSWQDVLKWTAEHSELPDFTFWKDRVEYGTLCAINESGYEQGLAAGKIAQSILKEGKSPASIPIQTTIRGRPFISLARARKLGLKIKSTLLLSATIFDKFGWKK